MEEKKEMSLPYEYLGAKCELKTLNNDLLTVGKIMKIGTDFLEISNDLGAASLKKYVDTVKVIVLHKTLDSRVIVGKLYIPRLDFFRVIDLRNVMDQDKRNFFRVNVHIRAFIFNELMKDGFDVVVIDLSLGGLYFTANFSLQHKEKFYMLLHLDDRDLEVTLVVQRIVLLSDGSYGYGCSFSDFDNSTADQVCQFLFRYQKKIVTVK